MIFLKLTSMAKMINAMISEATMTISALLCKSDHVGHDTLCISSFQDSCIYALIFI